MWTAAGWQSYKIVIGWGIAVGLIIHHSQSAKEQSISIKRVITRFGDNYHGFWKDYRFLIVVFVMTLLCDGVSTVYVLLGTGPESELHPIVRCVSRLLGIVIGPLLAAVAKALAGIVIAIYCRRFAAHLLITVSIISIWAAWYNMWGFKLYTAFIFRWFPF